jgi:hypothetical protein
VEVRAAAEILATLDNDGAVDRMPFMPEMLRHVGRRYKVTRRVDKICDTIAATGSRRMYDTVYLDDLRCDGSGHDGCQAGCKLYWKEAWLRRVDDAAPVGGADESTALDQRAQSGTRTVRELGGRQSEVWRCQATEAFIASEPLKTSDLRQYWREMTNGNFDRLRLATLLVRGLFLEVASRIGLLKPTPYQGSGSIDRRALNLQPGDFVQVRSPLEIAATLDEHGLNHGLSFDREMLPYCGQTFRVRARVRKIIDDKTGRMLNIHKDCIILDSVVCSGECSVGRLFCPREIYAYWREAWLSRVDPSSVKRGEAVPSRGSPALEQPVLRVRGV